MKKAKKGLLLSLLTLLMAVAVTATSTYAWFMVNTEVTASNMQVGVKSDTTFLVISTTNSLSAAATDADLTASGAITAVLPAKYDQATANAAGTWKKAGGTGYANGAAKNATYTTISDENLSKHYVKFTFYVGVTSTTAYAATNLKVSDFIVENNTANESATFKPAVSVLLVCGSRYINYTDDNGLDGMTQQTCEGKGTLLDSLTPGTANQIDAYVYINGDNSVVTSENATQANLVAFKVQIKFTCTEGQEPAVNP